MRPVPLLVIARSCQRDGEGGPGHSNVLMRAITALLERKKMFSNIRTRSRLASALSGIDCKERMLLILLEESPFAR